MKRSKSFSQNSLLKTAKWLALSAVALSTPLSFAGPTVSNLTAEQRPSTKLVDITYDLAHDTALVSTVTFEATTDGTNWTLLADISSTGNHGYGVVPGTLKKVIWRAGDEWPAQLFPAVKIRVRANDGTGGGVEPALFSLIPGGLFTMGSPSNELGRESDEPLHKVRLNTSFFISKTEVTWSQWESLANTAPSNGYTDMSTGRSGSNLTPEPNHPVSEVTWWDAIKYCNALSEKENKTPVYYTAESFGSVNVFRTGTAVIYVDWNADGYRLPTEAEWEYACRAGTDTAFYLGGITVPIGTDPSLEPAGWYRENSGDSTSEVGQKQANPWGLFDTHGNVWEWCWDRYSDELGTDLAVDPRGAPSGPKQVIRGAGYKDAAEEARSANRFSFSPNASDASLGFRIATSSIPVSP